MIVIIDSRFHRNNPRFAVENHILRKMHPEFTVEENSIYTFDTMIQELIKDEDFLRCGIAKLFFNFEIFIVFVCLCFFFDFYRVSLFGGVFYHKIYFG